ncbi:MAG: DUF3307 domain-containing protein [Candidatus Shapirobacteria bacterium]
MHPFIFSLAAHFVGDFAFQSGWMAVQKGKSWEISFYHAATYTAAFVLFPTGLSALSLGIILISHLIIDHLGSNAKITKHLWQDQILHLLVIIAVRYIT